MTNDLGISNIRLENKKRINLAYIGKVLFYSVALLCLIMCVYYMGGSTQDDYATIVTLELNGNCNYLRLIDALNSDNGYGTYNIYTVSGIETCNYTRTCNGICPHFEVIASEAAEQADICLDEKCND